MNSGNVGCPACASSQVDYKYKLHGKKVRRCNSCDLLYVIEVNNSEVAGDSPVDGSFLSSGSDKYFSRSDSHELLSMLQKQKVMLGQNIIVIGDGSREFCAVASTKGIDPVHFDLDVLPESEAKYDSCILLGALGKTLDLDSQMKVIRDLLICGGQLIISLPILGNTQTSNSFQQKTKRSSDRAVFFNTHNLTSFLIRSGFFNIAKCPETSDATFLCRKKTLDPYSRLLSIVLPVYNERRTLEQLITTVLSKTIADVEREIIIVESNSTDGSREIVNSFEGKPGVKIIYENEPRGKGHAVRNGLSHVSGDVILIQDADLEYDIDDYDALIEPVVSGHKLFVLGSRHTGDWKIRNFEDRKILSSVFNFGQIFFAFLINMVCGTKLKDPFTMYKVFHRECLYGLRLESNRFDLDWEIIIKFIRKGLIPIEIPVNYSSRSFAEGKKIRPFLDPIQWVLALIKFRWGPLYSTEKSEVSSNQ